jgi:hypothetical protein
MKEKAKKAGSAILTLSTVIHGLPAESHQSQVEKPSLVRKENEDWNEHGHNENGAPKPAEVRDGIVVAITSGQAFVPPPRVTVVNQETPPMLFEATQAIMLGGRIRPVMTIVPYTARQTCNASIT